VICYVLLHNNRIIFLKITFHSWKLLEYSDFKDFILFTVMEVASILCRCVYSIYIFSKCLAGEGQGLKFVRRWKIIIRLSLELR
jgi:hypothetical protein